MTGQKDVQPSFFLRVDIVKSERTGVYGKLN